MRKFIRVDRDLTGQKIHLLTAQSKIEKDGRWCWICSCECGGTTTIREDYFIAGKTKFCGCFGSRNSVYKINLKAPGESTHNSHYTAYKKNASKRGIDFDLTKEQFYSISKLNCSYCDKEPTKLCYAKNEHGFATANGIDRINNDLGYSIKNCVPCCYSCNVAKGIMTKEQFYEWIERVYLFLKKEGRIV